MRIICIYNTYMYYIWDKNELVLFSWMNTLHNTIAANCLKHVPRNCVANLQNWAQDAEKISIYHIAYKCSSILAEYDCMIILTVYICSTILNSAHTMQYWIVYTLYRNGQCTCYTVLDSALTIQYWIVRILCSTRQST